MSKHFSCLSIIWTYLATHESPLVQDLSEYFFFYDLYCSEREQCLSCYSLHKGTDSSSADGTFYSPVQLSCNNPHCYLTDQIKIPDV